MENYMKKFDDHTRFNSYEKFNRVLYGGHANDADQGKFFTLAGDTPIFMGVASDYTKDTWCYQAKNGVLMNGLALTPGHNEGGSRDIFSKWFHEATDVVSRWEHGFMSYEFTGISTYFPSTQVKMEVYPLNPHDGFAVHYEITVDQRAIFCAGFGGITSFFGRFEYHHSTRRDFSVEDCEDCKAAVFDGYGEISGPLQTTLHIGCDFDCKYSTDYAGAMEEVHPSLFLNDHEGEQNIIKIEKVLEQGETFSGNIVVLRNGSAAILKEYLAKADLTAFLRGKIREKYSSVSVNSPDAILDDTLRDTMLALDASFHGNSFFHGAIGYHAPFLGWRGWYAPALLGWAERVSKTIDTHFDTILRSEGEEKVWWDGGDRPDLDHEGTQYHHLENTHGRLPALLFKDDIYDMQEVAVDMTLYYLEHSNDMELCGRIYDRLCEVLDWEERILDPDGDGMYQNFLNTWISDGHSYNGAACSQASSYNYAANRRTAVLGRKLGRDVSKLEARAAKIQEAFQKNLCLNDEGVAAESIDTIGNKLVHASPELSTVYLAADCGNTDAFQTYRMLKWVERNIKSTATLTRNGKLFYSSNWLPKKYSTCGIFPAENACLALTYFQNGQRKKALEIVDALADGYILSPYPGSFSHIMSSTGASDCGDIDFTDVSGCYLRMLIEGLWGIRFQLQDNKILVNPQFPDEWNSAELNLPEISLSFSRKAKCDTYTIFCNKAAEKIIRVPMQTASVDQLFINGNQADYSIIPGFGEAFVEVKTKEQGRLNIQIYYSDAVWPVLEQSSIITNAGNRAEIRVIGGKLENIIDFCGITQTLGGNDSARTVLLNKELGAKKYDCIVTASNDSVTVYLPLEIDVRETISQPEKIEINEYIKIDISKYFNTSLTEIHNQEFRSPRPEGYSIGVRLNGRYAWEWNHYGHNALRVEDTLLRNCGGEFTAASGIPFATPAAGNNAVTVSLWDNFPTETEIPLDIQCRELAVLLCGTTNAMQSYVTNGVLTAVYEDGSETAVELIQPLNFDDFLISSYQMNNETVYFSDGTHGVVQKIPVDPAKKLRSIKVKAVANEVIVNILAVTAGK